ncbi:MAG: L,D-transpeptidase family protein [Magnetococcus sp. DMHC-8]
MPPEMSAVAGSMGGADSSQHHEFIGLADASDLAGSSTYSRDTTVRSSVGTYTPGYALDRPGLRLRAEAYLSTVSYGDVPWRRRWYPYAQGDEIMGDGELRYLVQGPETLVELARLFDLGFSELRDANPDTNVWVPEPGRVVRIPFRRVLPHSTARVVVNLPEMRVYHKRRDGWLDTYPIGIGQEGLLTPLGMTKVVRKMAAPAWYVPQSILKERPHLPKVVPPGPTNPLGTHAIYLSIPGYLMHGTQKPYGVGRRVSHGCMRLYPEDIVRFFEEVAVNDTVEIVNQPVKAGWQGEQLFVQVHEVLSVKDRANLRNNASKVVAQALARRSFREEVVMDWQGLEQALQQANGIPRVVGQVWRPPLFEHTGVGWAWEVKLHSHVGRSRATGRVKTLSVVDPVVVPLPPPPEPLSPQTDQAVSQW